MYIYVFYFSILIKTCRRSGFDPRWRQTIVGTHGISIRYTYERSVTDRYPVGYDDSGSPKWLKQVVPLPNARMSNVWRAILTPIHILSPATIHTGTLGTYCRPMCCKYRHKLLPTTIYVGWQYIIMTMSAEKRSKCDALHR